MKYIFLLIFILSISRNLFSQDTLYSVYPFIDIDYQPNKVIAKKRIKIVDEYYHWESQLKNDTNYLFSRTKYNSKGKVTEKTEYSGDYGNYQLEKTIKVNWLSDSTALIRIIYNKNYNNGELISYKDYCLSITDSGKTYFHDIEIFLKSNNMLPVKFVYLDYKNQPCQINYPTLSKVDAIKNKTEISDTIFENKRIKKIIYNAILDSQTINGYHQDAYTIQNFFDFYYDSTGRLTDKIYSYYSQYNNRFDTLHTKYIYYDSTRIKTILNPDYGYYGGRLDYDYDKKGNLIRETYDKYIDDSLIDHEYIYNKKYNVLKNSFYAGGDKRWKITSEEHYKDSLIRYTKYYTNNLDKGSYTIYKYSKKNRKLKNKVIIKLPISQLSNQKICQQKLKM